MKPGCRNTTLNQGASPNICFYCVLADTLRVSHMAK